VLADMTKIMGNPEYGTAKWHIGKLGELVKRRFSTPKEKF
jgi:hypothetical protein